MIFCKPSLGYICLSIQIHTLEIKLYRPKFWSFEKWQVGKSKPPIKWRVDFVFVAFICWTFESQYNRNDIQSGWERFKYALKYRN